MDTEIKLTEGQKAVDVSFNVGQREDVKAIKEAFAAAWDTVDNEMLKAMSRTPMDQTDTRNKIARWSAIAKTHLEEGSMAAVKAVTRTTAP